MPLSLIVKRPSSVLESASRRWSKRCKPWCPATRCWVNRHHPLRIDGLTAYRQRPLVRPVLPEEPQVKTVLKTCQ
jgi:hypothetical protein